VSVSRVGVGIACVCVPQVYMQKLLDEWILVQRTWLYLEPIFGSEDIMRQMPLEGRRFSSVDSMWRKTMAEVHEDAAVMTVAVRTKR
jgi:dynein heavy chain